MYLFYGLESYLIEKEIKNIIAKENVDSNSVITYDLNETSLEKVLEDASMNSLFDNKKVIICNNSFIFTSKKNDIDQDIDLLEKYILNINENTTIIFNANHDKIDDRKKIVKLFKEHGKIKEFGKDINFVEIAKSMFEDYKISYQDILYLVDRAGKDLNNLEQEINKLKMYSIDKKEISKEDIYELIHHNVDLNIFTLIDNIVSKNKEKAIIIYKEMLKNNEDSIKILSILADQFEIIYKAKELYIKGHTEKDITSILDIHPYRVQKALEKGRRYDSRVLLTYLEKLADLDKSIKSGNIDKDLGLELFILNI